MSRRFGACIYELEVTDAKSMSRAQHELCIIFDFDKV